MKKQIKGIFMGLVSVILLVGCAEKEVNKPPIEQKVIEGKTTSLKQLEPNHFVYSITNASEDVQVYTFPSGMQMDYTLYKDGGKLYTQSEVVSFTQATTELTLAPNGTQQYDILLEELEPGAYQLEVWSVANEPINEERQTITFQAE